MSEAKEKTRVSFLKIVGRTLSIVLRSGESGFFIVANVIGAVHSASWAINTFVMQLFFDSVQSAITGAAPASRVYLLMLAVAGVALAQQALNSVHNFMGNQIGDKYSGLMRYALHQKAARIDPIAYETPDRLDDIEKARDGGEKALNILGILDSTIFFYGVYFIIIGIYLFSLAPILALTLPIIFVPSLLNVVARVKVFSQLEDVAAPARRKMESHEKAIGDRAFFKETRTLGAYRYFQRQFQETLALFNRENWRAERKTQIIELGLKVITLCGYFGVLYILFTLLLNGTITLGAFAAVMGSIGLMISIMDEMVARNLGDMATALGKASNFIRFLDLPERTGAASPTGSATVEFKDAVFRYPGATRDALRGINLNIRDGETIAIVGENGAGKSTLVRLITGLYLPTGGSVKLRGAETRDIAPESLYGGMSAVMQAYQKYKLTLKQNVTVSDPEQGGDIAASTEKADLALDGEMFPGGEETILSREFDGVDLSGGQWQRVALARGFYRTHDMIVLDEPTAAIDPLEETKLYHKFAEISRDKTAVIVTHRLGSARIADRIVVMDDGMIEAIGTHDELLRAGGKYADMFHAQAQWYTNDAASVAH